MKKKYITPSAAKIDYKIDSLLVTASPGVGGDYDPNEPMDVKKFDDELIEDEEEEF